MSMSAQPATQSSNQPLGTNGDLRRRFLLHHVPLAFASVVVLVLFMSLPLYPHANIFSGMFPQGRGESGRMDHGGGQTMDHRGGKTGRPRHGEGQSRAEIGRMRHGREQTGPMDHGEGQAGPTDHGGAQRPSFIRQFTVATGYVALGLLALTLLIGPANLVLRRRTPVSNYLSRDVGTWAAIGSVVHTIFALQVHGSGRIRDFLSFFIAPDGSPLLNSFGLGNWTGLGALVIVVGLLAISSDAALGKLKAQTWKRLQRLNYALFALVILHAFFYGALLRVTSPFTLLLGVSVMMVFVVQAVGVWLWRRRFSRTEAKLA